MLLFFFFLIPFFIMYILFSIMEILLIPIVFLFAALISLNIFPGLFFWMFLSVALCSIIYLSIYLINLCFKNWADNKVIKIIIIIVILMVLLMFIQTRFTHTEMKIINSDTGERSTVIENFVY